MPTLLIDTHPHLAAQLLDPGLGELLTAGSNKKVQWQCPKHSNHIWTASVNNRTNAKNPRCPYCAGTRVLAGFNDLATTHPHLAVQLVDQDIAVTIFAGSGKRQLWQCVVNPKHQWLATPNNRTSTKSASSGCPYCANRAVLVGDNDFATTYPELAAQLVDQSAATTFTAGHNKPVEWICCKHEPPFIWKTSPILRVRQNTQCPVCSERTVAPALNDLATTHPKLAEQIADPQPSGVSAAAIIPTISRGSHTQLTWQCSKNHDHQWVATVKDRVRGTDCPTCANTGTSRKEAELIEVIRALFPNTDVQQGALINGRTGNQGASPSTDVLIPSKNLAIEFNGLYWHSELFIKDKHYHANKSALAEQAGVQLIHVWEDDWNLRRDIVIRMIAHKLHATHNLSAVLPTETTDSRVATTAFARTLTLSVVSGSRAAAFLNSNHIQGAVSATKHFALCDNNDDIRALLSVRSPKNNARMYRKKGTWEIQRYATLGNVPGGFTRLLKFAEHTLNEHSTVLKQWISFSAADVSDGSLYRTAGFTAEQQLAPDYRYVGGATGWRRTPKESFQRKRFRDDPALLWNESWTEHEAALNNELYRIYDAGKTRWVKNVA